MLGPAIHFRILTHLLLLHHLIPLLTTQHQAKSPHLPFQTIHLRRRHHHLLLRILLKPLRHLPALIPSINHKTKAVRKILLQKFPSVMFLDRLLP